MKNIQSLLSTAIVLAIALFSSVQMLAMESGHKINPNLTKGQKEYLKNMIDLYEKRPNNEKQVSSRLVDLREKYYGNESYTDAEIQGKSLLKNEAFGGY